MTHKSESTPRVEHIQETNSPGCHEAIGSEPAVCSLAQPAGLSWADEWHDGRTLIGQSLRRRAARGGLSWEYGQGLALGSPWRPLLGAFVLIELDEALARLKVSDVRSLDDLLVLAPTRWTLRQAVKVVNQGLAALGLETHPDKTCIGRVEHGFD